MECVPGQTRMFANIENALAELRAAISPSQPCTVELDIAELVRRKFHIDARIARAVRDHRKRSHLRKFKQAQLTASLAA